MEISDRQAKALTQGAFMLATAASSNKRHFDRDKTFEFRRREPVDWAEPTTADISWAESRPPTPEDSDDESEASIFEGYLPSYSAV